MIIVVACLLLFGLICKLSFSSANLVFWGSFFLIPSGLMLFQVLGCNMLVGEIVILLFFCLLNHENVFSKSINKHGYFLFQSCFVFIILMLFSSTVPILSQLKSYITEFLYFVVLIVLAQYIKKHKKIGPLFFRILLFALYANLIWSTIFELILGYNPTTEFVNSLNKSDVAMELLNESRGGFDFRIQSIFGHPLSFGQILLFIIPVVIYSKSKYTSIILFVVFLFIILSGTRGAIFPATILLFFYFCKKVNVKIVTFALSLFVILLCVSTKVKKDITMQFDNMVTLFTFWDESKIHFSGSSISLRIEQLDAAFVEMDGNYLFGRGKGYREYYQNMHHGNGHPKLLGYESLILLLLVERGIIGFLFYLYCLYYISFSVLKMRHLDYFYILSFLMFVLSAVMTGIRQYYILMFGLNAIAYYSCKKKLIRNEPKLSNIIIK